MSIKNYSTSGSKGLGVMFGGSLVMYSNSSGINVYGYLAGTATFLFQIPGFFVESGSVAMDGLSFVAWSAGGDVRVYGLVEGANQSSEVTGKQGGAGYRAILNNGASV